jgi:hypothetical protein
MVWPKGREMHSSGKGARAAFLFAHVEHAGNDCLMWPFSCRSGYGSLDYKGKNWHPHRLMCMLAHGEPPTPQHEAAHSCGRGHDRCVNPRHLSWKTRSENQRDRYIHRRRPSQPVPKLTQEQAGQIRALSGKVPNADLARTFNVSRATIRKIILGEVWRKAS